MVILLLLATKYLHLYVVPKSICLVISRWWRRGYCTVCSTVWASMYRCKYKTQKALLPLVQLIECGARDLQASSRAGMTSTPPATPGQRWDWWMGLAQCLALVCLGLGVCRNYKKIIVQSPAYHEHGLVIKIYHWMNNIIIRGLD